MASNQEASQFEQEVQVFRARTQSTLADYLEPFYRGFLGKLDACRESLAGLSSLGLPAWLVLDCLWRQMISDHVAKSRTGRNFRSPRYWSKLADHAHEFAYQLKRLPFLALDSDRPDTETLIGALEDWEKKLRDSPLTDENQILFYAIPPNGIPFVRPGYESTATHGPGRKTAAVDIDPSYLAWQLAYWLRGLNPDSPQGRERLAHVLYTFLDIPHTTDRAHTLTQRILHFEKEHRANIDEYKRTAAVWVQFAMKWYDMPAPAIYSARSD